MMDSGRVIDATKTSGDLENPDKKRNILLLFDVDGTLTPSRLKISADVWNYLQYLKTRVHVGLVGGSDLEKIADQMQQPGGEKRLSIEESVSSCVKNFDYVFAENGLVAYKGGELLAKQSLIKHLGEEKLQLFINFCLEYMSKLKLPVKRGNFIEFRNGLINVCPVGRSCSQEERLQFNAYDKVHNIRQQFINKLDLKFGPNSEEPLGLVYSIGGQISFDAFPKGWDKTFCLGLIDNGHEQVHFFGDKTQPGGNDHEIFADARTIGHTVTDPSDTLAQLRALNL